MMPHITQVRSYAAVRHRINVVALGIPLVDEEVVDPFLGRPRHVFIFEITEVVRRNEVRPQPSPLQQLCMALATR